MPVGFHEAGQAHADEAIDRIGGAFRPLAQCAGRKRPAHAAGIGTEAKILIGRVADAQR